jgi:hypothetical protein
MPKISDFIGQISDADAGDLPPGAAISQKNVSTTSAGKLRVRGGMQPATFTSTTTISASSYHTFQRMCFCKTRQGDLIGVNGIERGFRWDGATTNVEALGITAPALAPAIASAFIDTSDKGRDISGIVTDSGKYKVTSTGSHGLSNGDVVRLGNVVGTGSMANDLNGQSFTVESASGSVFTLSDTVFDGGYTSGGTWSQDGYGATAGDYVFGYRYIDDTTTAVSSSLTGLTKITALENDDFTWSSLSTTTEARGQYKLELFRSTAGVTNVLFKVATIAYGSIGSGFTDEVDDVTLNLSSASDVLLVLSNPPVDNSIVARRFEVPPNDRPVVVQFQDRYFYLGTVKYNRGTVAASGTAITGNGTDWVSTMVGRYIEIAGQTAPRKITVFNSATSLTVDASTSASSGTSYTIVPEQSNRRQVDFSEPDEPESVPAVNVFTVQESANDDDDIIGAMPLGSSLFLFGKRNKYAFSYSVLPTVDGSVRYVEDRGVFNHFCWDVYENAAYMMDDSGPYIFSGGGSQEIGAQIQDLWRKDGDGDKLDFTKTDQFHVKVDRAKNRAYFFVSFIGDSGNYPTRALVYNIRRKTWDNYEFPQMIGSAATIQISGETRTVFGAEDSNIYIADKGNTDVVTAEVIGTATGSSGTTLTDSGASFAAAVIGASVYIYEGTGKGQRRTITARTSTQLTVAAWTTNPDTTSKYVVGAIEWNWKSKAFGFPEDDIRNKREVSIDFKPTTGDQRIDVRFYYNHSATPLANAMSQKLGDAVEIQETNKEDAVVFMKLARSALEDSVGREKFRFDGMYSSTSHGDHEVSVELRGYAADDVPEIKSITVEGVEE